MKLLILRSNVGYQARERERNKERKKSSSYKLKDFHVCMSLMIFNFSLIFTGILNFQLDYSDLMLIGKWKSMFWQQINILLRVKIKTFFKNR